MLHREDIEALEGAWAGEAVPFRYLRFAPECHPGAGLDAIYLWPRGSVKLRCWVCKHEVAEIRVAVRFGRGAAPSETPAQQLPMNLDEVPSEPSV